MKHCVAKRMSLLALCSCIWADAFAGGILTYEIGTPDLGLASAGFNARAQDAATVMTNPAGMTRLNKTEILLGLQPFYGNIELTPNNATTVPGNDGGNAVGWFPGGGGYLFYNASPDLKLGLSTYGNFGSVLDYDDGWVGRYFVDKASLLGFTIAPALAYRIADDFSIGASFNAMYTIFSQTASVNNNPLGLFDTPNGQLKVSTNTWGYGYTLGILYEPSKETRIGITYISDMDLDFEDRVDFTGVLPTIIPDGSFTVPISLKMTVPQSAMISFFHQMNQPWALLGSFGWQDWQQFGKVDLEVATANPQTLRFDLNYVDTWHAAVGAQYQPSRYWRYSLGTAYDSSFVSSDNRTLSTPVGAAWRFGLGAQYNMCEQFNIGLAYTLVWGGDLDVNQRKGLLTGRVAGQYNNASLNYFGLTFDWKL